MDYDLILVGGGLAGSALAKAMAEQSWRVLVIEREERFRDRVRGEGVHPWGVAEARRLGLGDLLLETCAHEVRWWDSGGGVPPRDLIATTPHGMGELDFHHPEMQEVLLQAAAAAGADVRRGVAVIAVTPGDTPMITLRHEGGATETRTARLVVGADGRASRVRGWAGFTVARDPEWLMIAGLLLRGLQLPEDTVHTRAHPTMRHRTLVFPLGGGRYRAYFIYPKHDQWRSLSGKQHVPDFVAACIDAGIVPEAFADAEAIGPLAAFEGADTWVVHPYQDGVALVGDAAAASDPSWGCGLALTLRDVRVLRDCLLEHQDCRAAGEAYAAAHARYYGALHRLEAWYTELFYAIGSEADVRRARVLPRLLQERERAPDLQGLGPDGPHEETDLRAFG